MAPLDPDLSALLEKNRSWATERVQQDPDYFKRLANQQSPEVLWIGCSDSRVAANVITGTEPGEIFVHRNIANMVVHTDMNLLSVVEFAVNVLKVKHVMVVGHYGCGGVKAAADHQYLGIINNWLRNIEDVWLMHRDELLAIKDRGAQIDRLVELNVQEQVLNLAKTSIIQKAWKEQRRPTLHGWVYGLADGRLKRLTKVEGVEAIDPVFRYENF